MVRGGHAGAPAQSPDRVGRAGTKPRGFDRHRPPTHGPRTAAAWTCGTRRHRVTEKRYAGPIREVKSIGSSLGPPRPRPAAQPVDSALPTASSRGYVRASSSFPTFASALPRSVVTPPSAVLTRGL
jgi:hypothetical protein